MSAILSADDLNDFISPGVACIKPIETLPAVPKGGDAYEVTTEEQVAASQPPPPASISLTDCLACSGCVTSAEAVLVTLQSHTEVLTTLDTYRSLRAPWQEQNGQNGHGGEGRLFVASVSPQSRASLAAVFNVSEAEAGNMVAQLLSGPGGLRAGGHHGSDFTWVIDTNAVREACLTAAADEVAMAAPTHPVLSSACPGWICYAEKTHPYVLPHMSRLKSPQALTGTLVKSVLSRRYNIPPAHVWHVAVMPCFDKKLEASRSELTSAAWLPDHDAAEPPVRDVDCVITARELLQMASARGITFSSLPRTPLSRADRIPFPDPKLDAFLFPRARPKNQDAVAGPSGGYLYHILQTYQAQNPGASISVSRGRNADVVEYSLVRDSKTIIRAARFYGFRNIQNLVRRLKPAKASRLPGGKTGVSRKPGGAGAAGGESVKDYAYVEVMACPGGCTNGGGQVKVSEVEGVRAAEGLQIDDGLGLTSKPGPKEQKEWLARVDEAYFSSSDHEDDDSSREDEHTETNGDASHDDVVNGISRRKIKDVMDHWAHITGVSSQDLLYTSYREVESNVGKKQSDMERVAGLAVTVGGGW
jgi:iron only hydrogenase large subunit-like protein